MLCWLVLSTAANWGVVWRYRVTFWNGWLMTLGLSAMALVLSTVVGVLAALARRSSVMVLRYTASLCIELVRGMPLLVLLLVAFYVVAAAIQVDDRVLVGVVALSLFSGAYIAEMVRAGIESVGRSQLESARAIGLTTAQTYAYVIFPQAFRQTLPPLRGPVRLAHQGLFAADDSRHFRVHIQRAAGGIRDFQQPRMLPPACGRILDFDRSHFPALPRAGKTLPL